MEVDSALDLEAVLNFQALLLRLGTPSWVVRRLKHSVHQGVMTKVVAATMAEALQGMEVMNKKTRLLAASSIYKKVSDTDLLLIHGNADEL